MNWYDAFNTLEGVLWVGVAITLIVRVPCDTPQRVWAVAVASVAFVVFGVSDWLEVDCDGRLPLWLWGLKITCGVVIFVCRFTWSGWQHARLQSRELHFGLFCLIAVLAIMALQASLEHPHPQLPAAVIASR